MFGGVSSAGTLLNDLHVFDFLTNTWAPLSAAPATLPAGRARHSLAFTTSAAFLVLSGGQEASAVSGDGAFVPALTTHVLDVRCPALTTEPAVVALCTAGAAPLSVCSFACAGSPSLLLSHNDTVQCTVLGTWRGSPPACLPAPPAAPQGVKAQLDPSGSGLLLVKWNASHAGSDVGAYRVTGRPWRFHDDFDRPALNSAEHGVTGWAVDGGTEDCDSEAYDGGWWLLVCVLLRWFVRIDTEPVCHVFFRQLLVRNGHRHAISAWVFQGVLHVCLRFLRALFTRR